MTTCIQCHGGGAKRFCPALDGDLCPSCCARDQRGAIDCPADCEYLRPEPPADVDKASYQSAMHKLVKFATSDHSRTGQAVLRLAGPARELADWEQPLFFAYLGYGHADDDGDRAIDLLLREHRLGLTGGEVVALEALQATAWPSLFEIQAVEVDVGLKLLDLVTGDALFVREKSGTHQAKKFDLLLGWIAQLGDHFELTGDPLNVPRGHREAVLRGLTRELRALRKRQPGTPDRVLLREAIVGGQIAMRKSVAEWRPPRMTTMDGEDVILCDALFDLTDVDAATARLAAHPDMDAFEGAFSWVDRQERRALVDGPLLLGQITIERGRLRLETRSRERHERGKLLLQQLLHGVARHRVDAIKDFEVALSEAADRPEREPEREIPDEDEVQFVLPLLQQHVDAWIDEPIPLLKGKTPRQACKTKAGRAKVLALLRDHENHLQRQPGGDRIDFTRVYRELGLTR